MASVEDEESKPFLAAQAAGYQMRYSMLLSLKAHRFLLCLQLTLLCLNIALLFYGVHVTAIHADASSAGAISEKVFSPAQHAIKYASEELHYVHGPSEFTGDPRPEVDQAWSHLLRSTMVRVSEEEMRKMNKTSVTLRDGSGYVGYLESHYMLHCVKRLYQSQYPTHYPKLESNGLFSTAHCHHCLDVLRQDIMCNADITMNTFFWENHSKIKGDRSGLRKCIDWDSLQAWAVASQSTVPSPAVTLLESGVSSPTRYTAYHVCPNKILFAGIE